MGTARDRHTLNRVDAEDLWNIENVDQNGYICTGCNLKVIPCSHDKLRNKRRPYFRFTNPRGHEPNCTYENEVRLTKKAKKKQISTSDGFPIPYPSSLVLRDENDIRATNEAEIKRTEEITEFRQNHGVHLSKR